ncbi:MAG: hypothetical protein K6E30_00995 [Lachnospiraceae bacterium]|nr:hypothetical protein [Lachnospiraceae bacterium]
MRKMKTGSIQSLEPLYGSGGWLWGSDYTSGDLYEAEELYRDGHRISRNRLIFADPRGRIVEPLKASRGQYFGRPLYADGKIILLLADFPDDAVRLFSYDDGKEELTEIVRVPHSEFKDCYNLMPEKEPLMLSRQSHDRFEIIWPEKAGFAISPQETFCFRDGEKLYFSRWYEDPDYREEVVVRQLPDGRITEVFPGAINFMENGEMWVLEP